MNKRAQHLFVFSRRRSRTFVPAGGGQDSSFRRQAVCDDFPHEVGGGLGVGEEAELFGGLAGEHLETGDGETAAL